MKFEKVIKHKLFKYVIYALAIINVYGYTTKKKFNCLLSFVATAMVTNYFVKKNIPLALLVGLLITTFVLGCGKILEGMDRVKVVMAEHGRARESAENEIRMKLEEPIKRGLAKGKPIMDGKLKNDERTVRSDRGIFIGNLEIA